MTAPNIHLFSLELLLRSLQNEIWKAQSLRAGVSYAMCKAHALLLSVHIEFELVLLTPVLSSLVSISRDCGLVDPIHTLVLMDAADRIHSITAWCQQGINN